MKHPTIFKMVEKRQTKYIKKKTFNYANNWTNSQLVSFCVLALKSLFLLQIKYLKKYVFAFSIITFFFHILFVLYFKKNVPGQRLGTVKKQNKKRHTQSMHSTHLFEVCDLNKIIIFSLTFCVWVWHFNLIRWQYFVEILSLQFFFCLKIIFVQILANISIWNECWCMKKLSTHTPNIDALSQRLIQTRRHWQILQNRISFQKRNFRFFSSKWNISLISKFYSLAFFD